MRGRSRAYRRHGDLTSFVDVLFLLLFAALVRERGAVAEAAEEPAPADLTVPGPGADEEATLQAARSVAELLAVDEVILVAVSASGVLQTVERAGESVQLGIPLLRRTDDARVVAYLGDDAPGVRLCSLATSALPTPGAASRPLLVVATSRPERELGYALARGLRRDVASCLEDAGAYALWIREAPGAPDRRDEESP